MSIHDSASSFISELILTTPTTTDNTCNSHTYCVAALLRLPLPALEENIAAITTHVFEILQKYARFGSVGANRELIFAAFKVREFVARK